MTSPHAPKPGELPSLRQLNRASLIACGAAAIILFTTVLPAEYGVDPTGIGHVLGLTPMGEMKVADSAAKPADPTDKGDAAAASPIVTGQPVEVRITLQPNEGKEVKATMKAGQEFTYHWATNGPEVRFELHGEPANAVGDEYTSYEKGTAASGTGTFRAPFDGTHGWYWRNRTEQPVTITTTAKGAFEKFAENP